MTKLPKLKKDALKRKPQERNHKPKFAVIIICENEAEHQTKYEALTKAGYSCKAVRT